MKKISILLLLLCIGVQAGAQVKPVFKNSTQLINTFREKLDKNDIAGIEANWIKKGWTEETKKMLEEIPQKFGPVMYGLVSDSSYKTSKTEPKESVALAYITWHENAMLQEQFTLVNEKGKLKIASYAYKAGYGHYDDAFMNFGLQQASSLFVNFVGENKPKEAYGLFVEQFATVMSEEQLAGIIKTVKEVSGEFRSCTLLESCSALLYRKTGESRAVGLYEVIGEKDTVYLELKATFVNKRFYLYAFQFFGHYTLNNLVEVKLAEHMVEQLLYAKTKGTVKEAYEAMHADVKNKHTLEQFTAMIDQMETYTGKITANKTVDKMFCRSGSDIMDNEYMIVTETESEKSTYINIFLFGYDDQQNLKMTYFFLNQF